MNLDGSGRVLGSSDQASRAQRSPLGIRGFSRPKKFWSGDPSCTVMLSLTKKPTSFSNKEANYKIPSLDSPI